MSTEGQWVVTSGMLFVAGGVVGYGVAQVQAMRRAIKELAQAKTRVEAMLKEGVKLLRESQESWRV